jgi:hypothetical protein
VLINPAGAVTDAYRYAGVCGYYHDSAAVQYVRARWMAVGYNLSYLTRWSNESA